MNFSETSQTTSAAIIVAEEENVEVYRPDGVKAGNFASIDDARGSLPEGIYIVKNRNGKTYKIVVTE